MAEEKKVKTTKKKTESEVADVSKKVAEKEVTTEESKPEVEVSETEEVKVEKRFCTKCGKELSEGETCDCTANKATPSTPNINTDALVKYGKNFLDTVLGMYKKPATTIDAEVAKKDTIGNIIMLAVIAITYGLCVMSSFSSLISLFSSFIGANINDAIGLPYFKIFLCMTLINFILSFIPITIAFITNKICGKGALDYKKSISLYATSYAPTVITNLIMALMYALNILTWVGALIGLVIEVACFFNFLLGYLRISNPSADKKAYTLSGLVLVWLVLSFIINILFLSNLVTDVVKDVDIRESNNDYFDLFS